MHEIHLYPCVFNNVKLEFVWVQKCAYALENPLRYLFYDGVVIAVRTFLDDD